MPETAGWNVLITGACGMVGSHLSARLVAEGARVTGTYTKPTTDISELPPGMRLLEMDIRYPQHVAEVVERTQPDVVLHLAAQSYPTVSWERPQETLETNVIGTTNVFEAVRALRRRRPGYDPVVVSACSSAGYGASLPASDGPVTEDAALLPLHPYGVSKVATDLLTFQYWKSDAIRGIRARIFNCSGPRKKGDVISDFARRVAAMPAEGGALRVGNLATRRAFLHVDDLVEALLLLAERGAPGEAYNISGEEIVAVGALLPMFEAASGKRIAPDVDRSLLRPTDEPVIAGSNARLRAATGWAPRKRVSDIVSDVYADAARRPEPAAPAPAPALPTPILPPSAMKETSALSLPIVPAPVDRLKELLPASIYNLYTEAHLGFIAPWFFHSLPIPGDCCEFGCFKGTMSLKFAWALRELGLASQKTVYAFDTFEGFQINDPAGGALGIGAYSDNDNAFQNLTNWSHVLPLKPIKGDATQTWKQLTKPLGFVWLDLDMDVLMAPVLDGIMPLIQPDTILGIDDVGRPETPTVLPWVKRLIAEGRVTQLAEYPGDFIRFFRVNKG